MRTTFLLHVILSLALVNLSFGAPIPVRRQEHERHHKHHGKHSKGHESALTQPGNDAATATSLAAATSETPIPAVNDGSSGAAPDLPPQAQATGGTQPDSDTPASDIPTQSGTTPDLPLQSGSGISSGSDQPPSSDNGAGTPPASDQTPSGAPVQSGTTTPPTSDQSPSSDAPVQSESATTPDSNQTPSSDAPAQSGSATSPDSNTGAPSDTPSVAGTGKHGKGGKGGKGGQSSDSTSPSSSPDSGAPTQSGSASAPGADQNPDAPASSGDATPSGTGSDAPTQSGTGVPPSGSGASSSGAPHFVIYSDEYNNGRPPPVEDIDGFNVVALSFLQTNGAQDQVQEWTQLDQATQKSILDQYHAKGIKLIISLFGAEDQPTSKGADPVAVAQQAAKFVKQYGLDGVDVDYEDMDAINKGDGKGEQWIIDLTKTLRQELPQGQYIISHAPVAPWFQPGAYKAGAYVKVNQEVGSMIDFYNIQYYNQGDSAYTTCDDLITKSNSFPGTSIMELSTSGGIPASKLVIGKPGNQKSASNGYMDPATIGQCAALATKQGWNGGIMTWEYPDANAAWIKAAKGNTFTRRGRSVLN